MQNCESLASQNQTWKDDGVPLLIILTAETVQNVLSNICRQKKPCRYLYIIHMFIYYLYYYMFLKFYS